MKENDSEFICVDERIRPSHLEVRLRELLAEGVEPVVGDEPGLGGRECACGSLGRGIRGAVGGGRRRRGHLNVRQAPCGGCTGSLLGTERGLYGGRSADEEEGLRY